MSDVREAFPELQHIEDEYLVPHVRDVTVCAADIAETLAERRGADVSLDTVVAGALVHDVSKLHEFDGMDETAVGDLLGHRLDDIRREDLVVGGLPRLASYALDGWYVGGVCGPNPDHPHSPPVTAAYNPSPSTSSPCREKKAATFSQSRSRNSSWLGW